RYRWERGQRRGAGWEGGGAVKTPKVGDVVSFGEDADPSEILEVSNDAAKVEFDGRELWIPFSEFIECEKAVAP
ncbi:MAG: hypothetical protein KC587_17005, partial [Nitrospira sp.]|nr:hypothetical protein [Nitrospira sp.]